MNLNSIMDGIGARLDTIAGLRVYDFVADSISAPAAIVALPEMIAFDDTMGRGADRLSVPVHILVGRAMDRASRDNLAPYLDGSGALSIKAAIEADPTLGGAAMTTRVTEATVSIMTIGRIDYLAATFTLDVIA